METGARLVHACGFDSIPHDLGALFTVQQLPEGVPVRCAACSAPTRTFSGGTFATSRRPCSRTGEMTKALAERRKAEPRPEGRRVRAVAKRPHRDPETGYWLVPLPTLDPFVVKRSAAALERFGPDFSYAHYAAASRLPTVVGALAGVALLAGAAQVGPLRRRICPACRRGRPEPGEAGAVVLHDALRRRGRRADRAHQVSGGDPGYTETAKMLGECAMCLAFDDNPPTAGQVTTAMAMGERLTERLVAAGLRFEVPEAHPVTHGALIGSMARSCHNGPFRVGGRGRR